MRLDSLGRVRHDGVLVRGLAITDQGRRYLAMDWLGLIKKEPDTEHCRNGHRLFSPRGYCAACANMAQRRSA